jgi:hypothetical protein
MSISQDELCNTSVIGPHASAAPFRGAGGQAPKDAGAAMARLWFELYTKCDFSTQPGTERCFGGIGKQCEGISGFASFQTDEENCYVDGWMSISSILHDRCCVETNNTGYSCLEVNQGDRRLCKKRSGMRRGITHNAPHLVQHGSGRGHLDRIL